MKSPRNNVEIFVVEKIICEESRTFHFTGMEWVNIVSSSCESRYSPGVYVFTFKLFYRSVIDDFYVSGKIYFLLTHIRRQLFTTPPRSVSNWVLMLAEDKLFSALCQKCIVVKTGFPGTTTKCSVLV